MDKDYEKKRTKGSKIKERRIEAKKEKKNTARNLTRGYKV